MEGEEAGEGEGEGGGRGVGVWGWGCSTVGRAESRRRKAEEAVTGRGGRAGSLRGQ